MDDLVYAVQVCPKCLRQVEPDSLGDAFCDEGCDGGLVREPTTVRFRVARSQVIKQAAPRRWVVENTLYFGCVNQAGHYYWHRGSNGHPYKAKGYEVTPWGSSIDGGLFPRYARPGLGEAHVFHKDGWTALAFEDNSVDSRPGSWSIYCIPEILDGPEALELAREAFPPIFARYGFDVRLGATP